MTEQTITAKPQAFAAAVKWAARFIETKPVLPIQGGLLLESAGGELRISSMKETVSACAMVPVDGAAEMRTVVSGRLLDSLAATFPATAPVTLGLDGDAVIVTAGRWTGTLPAMNVDDFPARPAAPATTGSVAGEEFAAMIGRVAVAASRDDSKQISLSCLSLAFGASTVTALACDLYRVARGAVAFESADDTLTGALVPAQPMVDVATAFVGPDRIAVGVNDHQIGFTSPTRSVVIGQYAETYDPRIAGFFGITHPHTATVTVDALHGPMKRAALMGDRDAPILVRFGPDLIDVSASAEHMKQGGTEETDAEYDGPDVALHFNPRYFADALASAPGDRVRINLDLPKVNLPQPIIITVPGVDDWAHILMPIKPLGK